MVDNNRTKDVKSATPLKYLISIWRTLNMPLISCEVSLTLIWSENCVLTSKETRNIVPGVDAINNPTGATFKIKDKKIKNVPVVALSAENDNKLLEQLKTGFEGTITWKKYRSD